MPRRKESETVQTGLRMKEEMRAQLDRIARDRGVSLNTEIVERLARSLQQESVFGGRELSRMAFRIAAHFAVAVQDRDWTADPIAYAKGASAVFDELIRGIPSGPDKALALEAIVSGLLTRLAQAKMKEQEK